MHPSHVLETCLYVDDIDAAQAFYSRVLGLDMDCRNGERHVFFRCGGAMFLLFNPQQTMQPGGIVPPHGAKGVGHVAFAVTAGELPAWREWLHGHSVDIEAEVTWPTGGQSLYVRDPAGNSVELTTPAIWKL
jgi:catechol 2,3-dioxygenase-like lactoylglutathione lyase family enzyme